MRSDPDLPALYLITDRHAVAGGDLVATIGRALEGARAWVQLREKDLPLSELEPLAVALRAVTAARGTRLLVNAGGDPRRVELAARVAADGVHLTSADLGDDDVRAALERFAPATVGASAHDRGEVEAAAGLGAALATIGPVHDTPSKRGLGEPIGVGGVARAAVDDGPALFALGGMSADRVAPTIRAGAHGIACIRAVLAADDPADAARALDERVRAAHLGHADRPC